MTLDPLFVDASAHCRQPPSAWATLARDPAYCGVVLKASEGLGGTGDWFRAHWPAVRSGFGERYGVTGFRGDYHFLRLDSPGVTQADHYIRTRERAGGWDIGDLLPVVDVEEGSGNDAIVSRRGAGIVSDVAHAFVERVKQRTGREVVLYAGGWLRSLGLRGRLGCAWLWLAAYTRTLPAVQWCGELGFSADRLMLWQFDGSGASNGKLAGYPTRASIEHGEDVDISVLTLPGGVERLRSLLWAERPG